MNDVKTQREFDDLVQRVCVGTADGEARRRLGQLMEAHPPLQDEFIDQLSVNEMLTERYRRDTSPIALAPATDAPSSEATTPHDIAGRPPSHRRGFLAAAAAIVALVTIGALVFRGPDDSMEVATDATSDPEAVAIVADLREPVWADSRGEDLLDVGFELTPGTMHLESGAAQLLLDRGAAVTFIGPATFEVLDENSCRLSRGRMLAHVPPSAVGFEVETPAGIVRDLGTEFGLLVEDDGRAEVHVFKGSVEAEVTVGDRVERVALRENEAIELADGIAPGKGRLPINAAPFVAATGSYRPAAYVHWSFDSEGDASFKPTSDGFDDALFGSTNGPPKGLQRVKGRYGSGLRVGQNPALNTTFAGISGDKPRTVALWIKAEPDTVGGMIGWGGLDVGQAWQVSLQWRESDGPLGRLRIGVDGGQVVGTTDLRDNRWHHIAVVYRGGDLVEGTRLYVDGRPERIAASVTHPVVTTNDESVFIGRHIGSSPTMRMKGVVDEVYIIDGALAPQQIQMLMDAKPSTQLFGSTPNEGDSR